MKLAIVPAALAELDDAVNYYVSKGGIKQGKAFVDEFERVVSLVLAAPQIGTLFRAGSRRYLLSRFPYSVICQVASDELRVITVPHQRRKPGYWSGRK